MSHFQEVSVTELAGVEGGLLAFLAGAALFGAALCAASLMKDCSPEMVTLGPVVREF